MTVTNTSLAQKVNDVLVGTRGFLEEFIGWLTAETASVTLTDPYDPTVSVNVATPWELERRFNALVDPVEGTITTTQSLLSQAQALVAEAADAQTTFNTFRTEITGIRDQAATSAGQAAASATAAGQSNSLAFTQANLAQSHATAAATSATASSTSASSAQSSATAAAASALAAAQSAADADASADAAEAARAATEVMRDEVSNMGLGTVTSVGLSGGTTGLTVGGTNPVTSSGTMQLQGTLSVAHGGTGATTAEQARANLGAAEDANVLKLFGNQTGIGQKTWNSLWTFHLGTLHDTNGGTAAWATFNGNSASTRGLRWWVDGGYEGALFNQNGNAYWDAPGTLHLRSANGATTYATFGSGGITLSLGTTVPWLRFGTQRNSLGGGLQSFSPGDYGRTDGAIQTGVWRYDHTAGDSGGPAAERGAIYHTVRAPGAGAETQLFVGEVSGRVFTRGRVTNPWPAWVQLAPTKRASFGQDAVGSFPSNGVLAALDGRTYLGPASEILALCLCYSSARAASGTGFYLGATDGALPNLVFSNVSGQRAVTVQHDARVFFHRIEDSNQSVGFWSSSAGNTIFSYSPVTTAKQLIFDCTTTASNTAPTGGVVGILFRILGVTRAFMDALGNWTFSGFTKLGDDAPAIKQWVREGVWGTDASMGLDELTFTGPCNRDRIVSVTGNVWLDSATTPGYTGSYHSRVLRMDPSVNDPASSGPDFFFRQALIQDANKATIGFSVRNYRTFSISGTPTNVHPYLRYRIVITYVP